MSRGNLSLETDTKKVSIFVINSIIDNELAEFVEGFFSVQGSLEPNYCCPIYRVKNLQFIQLKIPNLSLNIKIKTTIIRILNYYSGTESLNQIISGLHQGSPQSLLHLR